MKNYYMRVFFVLLLLISGASGCSKTGENIQSMAKSGRMDLSYWDFERNGSVKLDGDWEFYWNELLWPEDFQKSSLPSQTGYFRVPGFWTKKGPDGPKLPGKGYATFRLFLALPQRPDMAVAVENLSTAYRLFIDGHLVAENGVPGKTQNTTIPENRVVISRFSISSDKTEVVLQVSNFHSLKGGPHRSIVIGTEQQLEKRQAIFWVLDYVMFGCLAVISLYHFIFYIQRKKDPSVLYFAVYCFLWCIRILAAGSGGKLLTFIMPDIPWDFMMKLNFVPMYMALPLNPMFFSSLYPEEAATGPVRFFQFCAILLTGVALVATARISSYAFLVYDKIAILGMAYNVWILSRSSLRGRDGAWILSLGWLISFLCSINDILYFKQVIHTAYLIPYGITVFILSQAFVLSSKFARSFLDAEALSIRLDEQNRELIRLDQVKDSFLANTSHELRTPLTGIVGLAESLVSGRLGALPAAAQSCLSMIVFSGKRLSTLINDILDYSKLKNNALYLETKAIDLRALADGIVAVLLPLAEKKGLELINQILDSLPPVRGDEDRIQQIFYNLLGNAIKFTESGEIIISAMPEDDFICVSISDTGVGIPEDRMARIFEPFEQIDGTAAREQGGTGLGLSITRHLVELHGGTVSVSSSPGKGALFFFTLPQAGREAGPVMATGGMSRWVPVMQIPSDGDAAAEEIDVHHQENLPFFSGSALVLVVDDDPVNLKVITSQLSFSNISVIIASGGKEALDIVESGGAVPDIAIIDVMMPRMTGYEVCKRLREKHGQTDLPIILLTARSTEDDFIAGFSHGANDYVLKPFASAELLTRVAFHLRLKASYKTVLENMNLKLELEQTRIQEEKAVILAEKESLEKLRYQLNPHFLFNVLASIKGAVGRNADSARLMITRLSELCRATLTADNSEMLSLGEDLITVRLYLEIEKIRMGDYLKVVYDLKSGTEKSLIPGFMIQPLVENAIKYGMLTSPESLDMEIASSFDENGSILISVSNSGEWVNSELSKSRNDSTGIGLNNIRQRLQKIYAGTAGLSVDSTCGRVSVTVTVPNSLIV